MDKKIEMTAEREGKILEDIISLNKRERTVRYCAATLADAGVYIATELLAGDDDKPETVRNIKSAIARVAITASILELIFGDTSEEEIEELEDLERIVEEAGEDA